MELEFWFSIQLYYLSTIFYYWIIRLVEPFKYLTLLLSDIYCDEFQKSGYHLVYEVTDDISDLTKLLQESDWDLIIANYNGPRYSALNALNITKEISLDIPFIVFADQYISEHSDEAIAVEVMKAGAHDFVTYDNLPRLMPAINREIKEAEIRVAHRRADETIRYQAYHDTLTRLPNRALFLIVYSTGCIAPNVIRPMSVYCCLTYHNSKQLMRSLGIIVVTFYSSNSAAV